MNEALLSVTAAAAPKVRFATAQGEHALAVEPSQHGTAKKVPFARELVGLVSLVASKSGVAEQAQGRHHFNSISSTAFFFGLVSSPFSFLFDPGFPELCFTHLMAVFLIQETWSFSFDHHVAAFLPQNFLNSCFDHFSTRDPDVAG